MDDPKGALPSYDALVLLCPARANDPAVSAALKPLLNGVPVEAMRDANYAVDREENKLTPAEAAQQLAERVGLN